MNTFKNIKFAWKYAKEMKWCLLLILLLNIFSVVFGIISPIYSAKIIVSLTDSEYKSILYIAIVILVIDGLYNLFHYFIRMLSMKVYRNTVYNINMELDKKSTNDLSQLKNWLYNGDVSSIFISDVIKDHYVEENENFENEVRILDTISIKEEAKDITKRVSMKNTPFNVLISGIDTFGKINKKSRNDVNIIATVNPNTNKILLTSIPRDYYVKLRGKIGLNADKIMLLDNGKIAATGTHDELLKESKKYKSLYEDELLKGN